MATRIQKEAIDRFFDYGLLTSTRTIYIGSEEVDAALAENVIKSLHILESSGTGQINITLNSGGGDVDHGMAIYDAIKNCSCRVVITVFGCAMSMGSVILQAADHRIVSPHSRVMIHHGTLAFNNHSKITYNWTEANKKLDDWTVRVYLKKLQEKHPETTYEDVDRMLNFDTILDGHEAVNLGLADEVLGEP